MLEHLRVLDCAAGVGGSYAAKLLADSGADVIKIEPPRGDDLRRAGPFPGGVSDPEKSGLFLFLNVNKRGITLDAAQPLGRPLLRQLAQQADVLLTDSPTLPASDVVHAGLVLTAITPFGLNGPYATRAGSDLVCMAMSGIVRSTPGNVQDLERQPPLRPGGRQGDFAAGVAGATATMLALIERESTGLGQVVDVSEWETLSSFMMFDTAAYVYDPDGTYLRRSADRRSTGGYPRTSIGIWPCKDGYVCIAVREQKHFLKLLQAMGDPAWGRDEGFRSRAARGQRVAVLNPLILDWTMQHSVDEICQLALEFEVPITPCNDARQLVESDHFHARQFLVDYDQPGLDGVRVPRGPVAFPAAPWRMRRPAPTLGQHNTEVYRQELGLEPLELERLRAQDVI